MPIAEMTLSDVQAMIGRDQEGQRLEFKVDIPVHPQRKKELVKGESGTVRDGWWSGKPIADYGRDKLLEELVAFANAQGGRLFLGIDDEDGTGTATAICPLPRVADLASRFHDILLSGVEPRLPQFQLQPIETDNDGSGVLIVEVGGSRLGPHRVTTTREIPIRRGDKCMSMGMPEVQEMVLRHARRFDEIRTVLDARFASLDEEFTSFCVGRVGPNIIGGTPSDRVSAWVRQGHSAWGIRIVICSHDDLGIQRLATFDPLLPQGSCLSEMTAEAPKSLPPSGFQPQFGQTERFLGGVRQKFAWESALIEYQARREGMVEHTFFSAPPPGRNIVPIYEVTECLSYCLFIYDRLRSASQRQEMPAEVAMSMVTRGEYFVSRSFDQMALIIGGKLPAKSDFPRRTVASREDYSELLNLTAQDLADAANYRPQGPSFLYTPG